MFCIFCGARLKEGSKFCYKCGAMVTDPEENSVKKSEDVLTTPIDIGDILTTPMNAYEEPVTLGSLVNDIETFSMDEEDIATSPLTEDGIYEPTVPLKEYEEDIDDDYYKVDEDNDHSDHKPTVAMIGLIFAVVFLSTALLPILFFADKNKSDEEAAKRDMELALESDDLEQVRQAYSSSMFGYSEKEFLNQEQEAVVNTLIDFYDNVYYEIDSNYFSDKDELDAFLTENWGTIIIDSSGYMTPYVTTALNKYSVPDSLDDVYTNLYKLYTEKAY